MIRFQIWETLKQHHDEWVAITRAGIVIDRGQDFQAMRERHRETRPLVTLVRVPPVAPALAAY